MDFSGLSDEPGARSIATRKLSGVRDRRTRRSRRGSSTPSLTINASAADADFSMAAAATADHRQADYFLGLLAQNRRLSEHRIGQYHKAIAICESNGDDEGAANFRRMVCNEEQDRQTLDGLIEKLRARFAPGAGSGSLRLPTAWVK
jgi:hypothetical protein